MGKLNVTVLRYLTREDFRVLTAVKILLFLLVHFCSFWDDIFLRWKWA